MQDAKRKYLFVKKKYERTRREVFTPYKLSCSIDGIYNYGITDDDVMICVSSIYGPPGGWSEATFIWRMSKLFRFLNLYYNYKRVYIWYKYTEYEVPLTTEQ